MNPAIYLFKIRNFSAKKMSHISTANNASFSAGYAHFLIISGTLKNIRFTRSVLLPIHMSSMSLDNFSNKIQNKIPFLGGFCAMSQASLDQVVIESLRNRMLQLEVELDMDGICLRGPILYGVEQRFNQALNQVPQRRDGLAIILDTPGGVVEVAERMVQCCRHFYKEVVFIIPNQAMSAGTVFAMSGDKILMNYYSVLGPIDPQIQKDGGKLIPALSYLSEYESLIEKSRQGSLTTAEYTLLQKLDLGELHTFKQARDLSIELLENWLSTYKFKDWKVTQTKKVPVNKAMRKKRANEIAQALVDHEKWHSHSRCISMNTLISELNIQIEDYGINKDLTSCIHDYFDLLVDFLAQRNVSSFVHSSYYI